MTPILRNGTRPPPDSDRGLWLGCFWKKRLPGAGRRHRRLSGATWPLGSAPHGQFRAERVGVDPFWSLPTALGNLWVQAVRKESPTQDGGSGHM